MTAPQLTSLFPRVPLCVDVLDNCMARFCTYPQCLKMCCRHIFHKEGRKNWKHQHTSRDLTSRSPCYYAQAAERMTSTAGGSTFQFLTPLCPPHPTATGSTRFPLLCGKGHHVYILVLLSDNGRISALRAPLLFDKDSSKASVSVAAASQEDRDLDATLVAS